MVNQALVARYFEKGEDLAGPSAQGVWRFAGDHSGNRGQHPPNWIARVRATGNPFGQMSLVVSTRLPPESLVSAVRGAIAEVDRGVAVSNVKTMDRVIADSLADRSLYAVLLGIFAGVALILSSAGIYGVLSFLVSQRRQEIGIRMALGATASKVLKSVVVVSLKPVLVGIALGFAGALAATRALKTLLYGVAPKWCGPKRHGHICRRRAGDAGCVGCGELGARATSGVSRSGVRPAKRIAARGGCSRIGKWEDRGAAPERRSSDILGYAPIDEREVLK